MGSAAVLNRPAELWQQSSTKLQQSSTKWQQSTTEAWRRSTTAWHDTKDRCHRTTMETWHKSADSWRSSKDMCRQSTAGMLARSANRIYQSTDRLQQMHPLEHPAEQKMLPAEQNPNLSSMSTASIPRNSESPQEVRPAVIRSLPETSKPSSPPSPPEISKSSPSSASSSSPSLPSLPSLPPSQSSPASSISCASTTSPQSPSETGTSSTALSSFSVDLSKQKRRPDEQIRGLLRFTDHVSSQVEQAKRLRNSKSTQLGEIEHNWIHSTIVDADDSARELAALLEKCRLDLAKRKGKGKVSSKNRKQWKLQGRERAEEMQSRLIRFQGRLDRVLNHLENLQLPQESPTQELAAKTAAELLVTDPIDKSAAKISSHESPDPAAELPSAVSPEAQIPVAELPSLSGTLPSSSGMIIRKPVPFVAELPGDSAVTQIRPAWTAKNVPRIIVTNTPDDSSFTLVGSPDTPNAIHEHRELNEILSWKETRNSIRLQQSESLSKIVSSLERTRSK